MVVHLLTKNFAGIKTFETINSLKSSAKLDRAISNGSILVI